MMNKRGNIMLGLIFFVLALGVFVVYMSPIASFIELAQGSNNLNCRSYIDESASNVRNYSYNASLNTDSLSCIGVKLILPFLILVFIASGITNLIKPGGSDFFGSVGGGDYVGG